MPTRELAPSPERIEHRVTTPRRLATIGVTTLVVVAVIAGAAWWLHSSGLRYRLVADTQPAWLGGAYPAAPAGEFPTKVRLVSTDPQLTSQTVGALVGVRPAEVTCDSGQRCRVAPYVVAFDPGTQYLDLRVTPRFRRDWERRLQRDSSARLLPERPIARLTARQLFDRLLIAANVPVAEPGSPDAWAKRTLAWGDPEQASEWLQVERRFRGIPLPVFGSVQLQPAGLVSASVQTLVPQPLAETAPWVSVEEYLGQTRRHDNPTDWSYLEAAVSSAAPAWQMLEADEESRVAEVVPAWTLR